MPARNQLAARAGLPLKLKTVATSINQHEISADAGSLRKKSWVEFKFDARSIPALTARKVHWRAAHAGGSGGTRYECSKGLMNIAGLRSETWRIRRTFQRTIPSIRGEVCKDFALNAYGEMGIFVISQQDTLAFETSGYSRSGKVAGCPTNRKRTAVTKCIECRTSLCAGLCPANGEMENGDKRVRWTFLPRSPLAGGVIGVEVQHMGMCILRRGSERQAVRSRRDGFLVKRSTSRVGWGHSRFSDLEPTPARRQGAVGGCRTH